jgi:hydroxymethylpyrimidine pyrophosphatase-like HAD family hydrolase
MRLISTDFDGTLIGFDSDGRCSPAFAAVLEKHHRNGGMWAINTGRSLDHAIEGFERFRAPVTPDFLLTLEREIYQCTDDGVWISHGDWNANCEKHHAHLFSIAGNIFSLIERLARDKNGINIIYEEEVPAGLVTATEEIMDEVALALGEMTADLPEFSFQRNTVYLRFCHRDYHKGAALGELCRLENIPPGEVLAAGDHFNDLSMLDGSYAKMTACPANAIEPVKKAVRESGGYVAQSCWADGIAEAVRHFEALRRTAPV